MFSNRVLIALWLAAASTTAAAQQASTAAPQPATQAQRPQLTPQQQQALAQQNQHFTTAAGQVVQLIDQGQVGQVWDGASSIAKNLVSRDAFTRQIEADRKSVGAAKTRTAKRVTYSQGDGKSLPAGVYANVIFATQFANLKQPIIELVSFHLDPDKQWRLSGYTVRAATK